jgi:hypothetical protein
MAGSILLLGLLLPATVLATVGNNSCLGVDFCTNNTGIVGNNTCNEAAACFNNAGAVGNNACTEPRASKLDP